MSICGLIWNVIDVILQPAAPVHAISITDDELDTHKPKTKPSTSKKTHSVSDSDSDTDTDTADGKLSISKKRKKGDSDTESEVCIFFSVKSSFNHCCHLYSASVSVYTE